MTIPNPLSQLKCLYHFTDRRNLGLIRQLKGIYSKAGLEKAGITIPAPGGNEHSLDADKMVGMDRYVHLCFCNQHPMEYLAKQAGRIEDSIFLEIDPAVLTIKDSLFTPGVSNKSGMTRHTIDEAKTLIDFEIICTKKDWKVPELGARRRAAEKCEILIPTGFSIDLVRNMPNG